MKKRKLLSLQSRMKRAGIPVDRSIFSVESSGKDGPVIYSMKETR